MIDYAKYLAPIPNSGFNCNGCGNPIEKGGLFCACADCGAIYCQICTGDGTFENHACEKE